MKKSTSIHLLTQLNQVIDENNAEDDEYYLHELIFNQQQNIHKECFRKYYNSDLASIFEKKENKQDFNSQNEINAKLFKDVAKIIHEQFIQARSPMSIEKRFIVPEFIRQRDKKKKKGNDENNSIQ